MTAHFFRYFLGGHTIDGSCCCGVDIFVRAERRQRDLLAQGHAEADVAQVRTDLVRRDNLDSGRETAPLAIAADAILVENDHVTIAEIVDLLADLAMGDEKRGGV